MKLRYFLIVMLALTGTILQSCSSDDSGTFDPETLDSDTYIRFTIDETEYDFENIATAESQSITFNGNNGATLQDVGDTQISIWLPLEIVVGDNDIEGGAFGGDYKVSFSSEPMGFDFDFAESGNINITSVSEEYVEGTFTATITSEDDVTIQVNDGSFRALTID